MIEPFTIYDKTTGRILWGGFEDPASSVNYDTVSDGVITGQYGNNIYEYVQAGSIVQRPTITTPIISSTEIQADGTDSSTISGFPSGWAYEISNGDSGITDGTDIIITALESGAFVFLFTNWPYQDIEYRIYVSSASL